MRDLPRQLLESPKTRWIIENWRGDIRAKYESRATVPFREPVAHPFINQLRRCGLQPQNFLPFWNHHHMVNQAVFHCLFSAHIAIPLRVSLD